MLSQTVEYALRAMTHLAYIAPEPSSTDAIATSTKVPRAYLSKVLQGLRKAGLVHSRRGVGGGVTLAKPPAEISILEVVTAVEPIERIRTCPLGLRSHGTRLCALHAKLDAAYQTIESTLADSTLAEIIADPNNGSPPLCESICNVGPAKK